MTLAGIAASALYGITLAFDAAVVILAFRTLGVPLAEGQPPLLEQLPFYVPILLAYSTVGAVVAAKRPRNPIGWLFIVVAIGFAASLALAGYALDAHVNGSASERAQVEAVRIGDPIDLVVAAFGFIVLLYPTGRLPSTRWWPLAVFMLIAVTFGRFYSGPGHELFAFGTPLALTAPFIRLRHASPVERRQIEWFGYFIALGVLAFVASLVVSLFDPNVGGFFWGFAAFCVGMTAVAAGIAILRYRLYDIDVLIRRTVIYAAVSAVLLATYVGGVAVLQTILAPLTSGSGVAVAISTLGVVALFQPLRRRIQSAVDRRFYRAKYDAEKTLDTFAGRLRDEVELDSVRAELLTAVGETLQPAHASVWLREAKS
ncbi:MAG: YlaC family protein [Chloroflexota bacterium]|nr:YlaC family protein [Chloroflexota bacterium]